MQFEHPFALLLLLLALPLAFRKLRESRKAAVTFPGIRDFKPERAGLRQKAFAWLPWLRLTSLTLLVLAAAGPKLPPAKARNFADGAAIELVVDRSASMGTADLQYQGVTMSRLEAVKRISRDFVFGGELGGRPHDLIGLIGFAADPVVLSPLTLLHELLRPAIEKLQIARNLREDGTAIGDAVATAAERLHADAARAGQKLIVLITDGENNLGRRSPRQAAELAKGWGIRICVIMIRPDARGIQWEQEISSEMQVLAGETGGIARTATDGSALRAVYREVDRLGTGEIEQAQVGDVDRVFQWTLIGTLLLMTAELALRETWLRKVPA